MSKEKSKLLIHLLIAIAFLPLQSVLGEWFKLALDPYIFYLVWARNPLYLPALFIYITAGSTISYVILISTFLLTIFYIPKFRKMGLRWLMLLVFLPLPVFVYMTGVRLFSMGLGLVDILIPLGFYLGLFPFFYGIIIAPKMNKVIIQGIFLSLFILPFLKFMPGVEISIRAYWFSFPLFFGLIGAKIFLRNKFQVPVHWILLSLIFIIFSISSLLGLKFTLLFSAFVTIVAIIASINGYQVILSLFSKPRVILISFLLVVGLIYGNNRWGSVGASREYSPEAISYFEWDEFWTDFRYKATGDRAVIWAAGWNMISQNELVWPPYEVPEYSYITNTGTEIEEVQFGIHNIGLELMRNYGMVVGGFITLIYLLLLIIGPGGYLRKKRKGPVAYTLLAGACLGTGLVGGLVGQYVLMVTFSFILMSVCGMLYASKFLAEQVEFRYDK